MTIYYGSPRKLMQPPCGRERFRLEGIGHIRTKNVVQSLAPKLGAEVQGRADLEIIVVELVFLLLLFVFLPPEERWRLFWAQGVRRQPQSDLQGQLHGQAGSP